MKIDLVKLVEEVYKLEGEPKNVNKVFALICLQAFKEQLTLTDVVKSLPTDEEIYSEGCSYVRKIEQPNRQPLITLRRTFKAGAEFVKKQLYN